MNIYTSIFQKEDCASHIEYEFVGAGNKATDHLQRILVIKLNKIPAQIMKIW